MMLIVTQLPQARITRLRSEIAQYKILVFTKLRGACHTCELIQSLREISQRLEDLETHAKEKNGEDRI